MPALPQWLAPQMQRAIDTHRSGCLAEAESLYRKLRTQAPDAPELLDLHGVVLSQMNRHAEALQALQAALALQPQNPAIRHNLARAMHAAGDLVQAQAQYDQVLRAMPDFTEARFNLANLHKTRGRIDAAVREYEQVLRREPAHFRAHYNLGNALMESGRYRSAAERLRQVLMLQPTHAEARNNLGIALGHLDEVQGSEAAYREAMRLREDWPEPLGNLVGLLDKQGRDDEAAPLRRRLLELRPADELLRLQADAHCPIIAQSNIAIDGHRRRLDALLAGLAGRKLRIDPGRPSGEPPFVMAYHGRDDLTLKRRYADLFRGQLPQLEHKPRSGKPHVGIVVTQGHEGVFLKCLRGIVERLPEKDFRLSVVCGPETSAELLRGSIKRSDLRCVPLPRRLDHALQVLAAERFDLLHWWEVGSDAANYFLPMCRPARVQSATWGWPVSSGILEMDWYVSSARLEAPEADAHYSEKLVRLPSLPSYYYRPPVPEPAARKSRDHYGLRDDRHAYLCLQNLRKVHPDMDELFARILDGDPSGDLLLIDDAASAVTAQLRGRLEHSMPQHRERIRFLPRMGELDFLSLVTHCEVVLDTRHYTGGANTAADVFASGTPTITWPTQYHRGRYTMAAYEAIGVADCTAHSADEYVKMALRYGSNRAERADKSLEILANCAAYFEDRNAVNELADFFARAITL